MSFGHDVFEKSLALQKQGLDVNQIANKLASEDSGGSNYGAGIILDGKGKPINSSAVMRDNIAEKLGSSSVGQYENSAKSMELFKRTVLRWQQIPEKYDDNFIIALPSDAGTGAVSTGLQLVLNLYADIYALSVMALGWPAYRSMALANRIKFIELRQSYLFGKKNYTLPLLQLGPLNTTGEIESKKNYTEIVKNVDWFDIPVLLDRAYSGFAYADMTLRKKDITLAGVMKKEYNLMIKPFLEAGVETVIAISPTKCFGTFSFRPAGILLIYSPNKKRLSKINKVLNQIMRARGSAFEHLATRALVSSFTEYNMTFMKEHFVILQKVAQANQNWKKLCKSEKLKKLFGDNYAGIFRNFPVRAGSEIEIYDQHIYPVFSTYRSNTMCRVNTTGLPDDKELAKKHISAFEGIMI